MSARSGFEAPRAPQVPAQACDASEVHTPYAQQTLEPCSLEPRPIEKESHISLRFPTLATLANASPSQGWTGTTSALPHGEDAPVSLSNPSPPELPLGRYEDHGLIGTGGMGEVRRVLDRDLNRLMAMKIIRADLLSRPTALARFIEEAQTNAQLEHPGIVPLHELGQLPDGRFYFTMKEVRGRTLKAVIQEVHAASPGERWQAAPSGWTFRRLIDAFHKVCEAVAYAHSRGVVHRDLKPSNVMVGRFGEVMVMDWGLARILGSLRPPELERSVSGTPSYMPPEQARGETDRLGPTADVYALGALLYEILSGRPPYEGPDAFSVLGQVLAGPPRPPGRLGHRLPEGPTLTASFPVTLESDETTLPPSDPLPGPPYPNELREICLKAMARDPLERYPEGAALASALEAFLEDDQRRERGLKVLEDAVHVQPAIAALRAEADRLRSQAEQWLAQIPLHAPITDKRPGWKLEDAARRIDREADLKEIEYLQLLRASLTHVPDLPETHDKLAEYYRTQQAVAEEARDQRSAARYETLLRGHDQGRYATWLKGDGALTLVTEPPGAQVTLFRYEEQDRRQIPQFVRSLGHTPLVNLSLPMGSYLLELHLQGHLPVRYPVAIRRQHHWDCVAPGETDPHPLLLPRVDALGPNDCYVPAGWFVCGGDPEAYFSFPRRRLWVDAFCMRRFPVTHLEYQHFLNELVARGRSDDAERWEPRARPGQEAGPPLLIRSSQGRYELNRAVEQELMVLPVGAGKKERLEDIPVLLVDWHCAMAYAAWEAERSGHPWRLPVELEWEKAARGVDERLFPWGDYVDPTWTVALESQPDAPRPRTVFSCPEDSSPYEIRGMGGNVRDWCLDAYTNDGPRLHQGRVLIPEDDWMEPGQLRVIRGGAWANSLRSVRVAFRSGGPSTDRFALLGFRLARSMEG